MKELEFYMMNKDGVHPDGSFVEELVTDLQTEGLTNIGVKSTQHMSFETKKADEVEIAVKFRSDKVERLRHNIDRGCWTCY